MDKINVSRYDDFVLKNGVIQQSSQWLKSQTNKHHYPLVIIVETPEKILGVVGIIYSKIFSSFLVGRFIIPGNPIIDKDIKNKKDIIELLFNEIDKEAKKRRVISIEWDTLWSKWEHRDVLKKYGYQIKELNGWILELTKKEEVYEKMSSSHKRWINKASKENIKIYESNDLYSFYKLWRETYKRKGKNLPLSAFRDLKKIHTFLSSRNVVKIFFAEKEGRLLCGNFMLYYGDTIYYLHGGSISGQKYGAPHLLHWTLIKDGIQKGYKYYYFGGSWTKYSDENSKKQAEGINEFKRRFGAIPKTFYCGNKIISPFRKMYFEKMITFYKKLKHNRS